MSGGEGGKLREGKRNEREKVRDRETARKRERREGVRERKR